MIATSFFVGLLVGGFIIGGFSLDCGWIRWLTNPAVTNSAQSEMASYRQRLLAHLSCLLDEPESLNKDAA